MASIAFCCIERSEMYNSVPYHRSLMNGIEKKLWERNRNLADAVDITRFDDNAQYLIGWPGYRTAIQKSGLGYFETQAEWAHIQGVMFRRMLDGKFKTRHPVYFICLTAYGIISASPLLLLFSKQGQVVLMRNSTHFLPAIAVGVLILVNMVLSLTRCEKGESITGD